MALRAGLIVVQSRAIGIHIVFQLIVGPLFTRSRIIGRLVHYMTRHAGHLLGRIIVCEAGRIKQTIIFPPGNADHSIVPKRVHIRFLNPQVFLQCITWLKRKTVPHPVRVVLLGLEIDCGVALAADLGTAPRRQFFRLHDCQIIQPETGILNVLRTRPMARFASDTEIGHMGVIMTVAFKAGLGSGRMAAFTHIVPSTDNSKNVGISRWAKKVCHIRNPALLVDPIGKWKSLQCPPLPRSKPIALRMVRTGQEYDRPPHDLRLAGCVDFFLFDPKLITILPERNLFRRRVRKLNIHIVKGSCGGLRAGNLRHRAVVRVIPSIVVVLVALSAGFGTHITIFRNGDRPILRADLL